jgi:cell division protein FtsB
VNEVLDLLENESQKKVKDSFYVKIFLAALIVIIFGVYVGNILFGKNSLEVLLNLQEEKTKLQKEIKRLKRENAALQKDYFELRQLEPE